MLKQRVRNSILYKWGVVAFMKPPHGLKEQEVCQGDSTIIKDLRG
ncbi:Hypothetical protein Bdt_3004 [Bdellovibrio bacteriovorus str. Tiberius]|uniref:Uncharacterized protein n=1 Tax=Bdellovibrio bacteriovorus str. Tiberius TaxID=1069642 RepID=K7ZBW0_BDEBC|nr:Hypothetical protein Bdt_3004 [Bdellovibrio bacteriovorus str. Tiberius]